MIGKYPIKSVEREGDHLFAKFKISSLFQVFEFWISCISDINYPLTIDGDVFWYASDSEFKRMSRIANDHNTYADDWSLFDLNIPMIFINLSQFCRQCYLSSVGLIILL